jgi:CheY-like chemotaxis protein
VVSDQQNYRLLIAEDDPTVVEDYLRAFKTWDNAEDVTLDELGELEADLFGRKKPSILNTAVFDTVYCRQGGEAIDAQDAAIKAETPFDLALIDVRMPPGMDGIEAAEQLRSRDQNMIIGIVTGYSDVNTVNIQSRLTPVDKLFFVRKPFVSGVLRQLVLKKLEHSGAGGGQ